MELWVGLALVSLGLLGESFCARNGRRCAPAIATATSSEAGYNERQKEEGWQTKNIWRKNVSTKVFGVFEY